MPLAKSVFAPILDKTYRKCGHYRISAVAAMAFALSSRPSLDVHKLAEEFEHLSLTEVLRWTWETFGDKAAIGTSFQGSGLVIIDHAVQAGLKFPIFTVDTGLLFPETYELKERLERHFGIAIEGLQPAQTVEEQHQEYGRNLWETNPDTCCTLRKVLPLQKRLAGLDVWITGVRRNQSDTRSTTKILELYEFDKLRQHYILKLNPMAAWSREAIWNHIKEKGIPSNALHDRGYKSIGCWPCTKLNTSSDSERAGRWEGFDKTECGIHTFLGSNI
jgi:phosphoadenosine phosphosulfate reductase